MARSVTARYDDTDGSGWQQQPAPPRRGGPAGPPGGPGRKPRSIGLMVSGILAGLVALVLVAGSLVVYVKYRQVWDDIKRVDISADQNGFKQPPVDPNAINILLIGSDSRAGVNGKIGGQDQGQRSDTVMVLHIAPGSRRATVLSFPRDSVVPIESCTAEKGTPGQTADPGQIEQINSTFANGGPGCLFKTIEETTNIHLNDFVELTFIGFEKVINDLGGVTVCLPEAVDNPQSNLDLSAGRHHIFGYQALAFWRTRENLGEGSDLQRIQRDQFLMASLLQGIEKSGLLTSTTKLASVIGDVAKNMTTDSQLTQSTMLKIGESVRGLSAKSVDFIEIPVVTYLPNPDWVQWSPDATQLFSAIAHDTKLPKKGKAKPAVSTVQKVSPANVRVEVLNGSGQDKVAATGSADLTAKGFDVLGSSNAANFDYTKNIIEYHGPADRAAAQTVAAQFDDVALQPSASVPAGTIDAILGSDFTSLKSATAPTSTANLARTFGGITGNTRICKDNAAFAGPG
jgi:LCP family protein required for cell wall assembly